MTITADEELKVYRKFVIEECARVAETVSTLSPMARHEVGIAIRALKERE